MRKTPVMARFPSKEAEVFALAQEMMSGSAANAPVYPPPPVHNIEVNPTWQLAMFR